MRRVAILTFDGFNEIDTFVALNIINRARPQGLQAEICAPAANVESMNGVRIAGQRSLEFANEADAVLVGSGRQTRRVIEDDALLSRLHLDPTRQLIGSQCSGALLLWKLGLLDGAPVCTDNATRPYAQAAGLTVLDQPFFSRGNVATAGGCLAATYLAAWTIVRLTGKETAAQALSYVAPIGEESDFIGHALSRVDP
jgi:transcriptional regulator GlxA family with amidase domain